MEDNDLTPRTREYVDFMKWFKEKHPFLYEKYNRNIGVSFELDGGITVSNDFNITMEEFDMLSKIVGTFYNADTP